MKFSDLINKINEKMNNIKEKFVQSDFYHKIENFKPDHFSEFLQKKLFPDQDSEDSVGSNNNVNINETATPKEQDQKQTQEQTQTQEESGPKFEHPRRLGLIILIVFVGGFLLWASIFKIESAAVAQGKIVIDTNRKSIQHLEGGIVKALLVREGSHVKMGQDLILLDPTQAVAALNLAEGQTELLLARKAYLDALEAHSEEVIFPEKLLAKRNDPDVSMIMNNAKELFESKKNSLAEGISILENKIEVLKHEIASLNAQIKAHDAQMELLKEEINSWLELENKNYIDKPRLLSLKRELARLDGDKNEKLALISKAEQQIAETELQINHFKDQSESENRKGLEETEYSLIASLEKESAARDLVQRLAIKAPISGTVLNLKVHTIGGVIAPREILMDIVPDQERLIVEARVNPNDIDIVHPGLPAKVKLTVYKQRLTPTLEGKVVSVSADLLLDEKTNQSFYTARILVDQKELAKLKKVMLYPGMPVQVFIVIGKRTPLDYFLTPIFDSFAKAFKEE